MLVLPQLAIHADAIAIGDELPPLKAARELVARGARELLLHDLDGTLAGDVVPEWVQSLIAVSGVPVRVDARLVDGDRLERIARAGFDTVVIGQAAAFEPMLARWALDLYGSRACVELQVDDRYLFDPPANAFDREVDDLLGDLHMQGVRRVLYRDVGAEATPLQRLLELGDRAPGLRLTYHGAVRTVGDVEQLTMVGPVLEAVVVGSDLVLDGSFDLVAANELGDVSR